MQLYLSTALGAALVLSAAAAQAAPVDLSTLQLNGSAALASPTVLRLTSGPNLADPDDPNSNIGMVGTAFIGTAFSSNITFTSSFTFSLANTGFDPLADGITFLIQNDGGGAFAQGGGGAGIGASGLSNNVGVGFQSWDNNHATIFTDGDVSGGTGMLGNFNLGDQDDVVDVTVTYDGTTLSYTAFNTSTMVGISDSFAFDLSSLGPEVYFGFTGATGLSHSIQDITAWDLVVEDAVVVAGVPEPGSWALMIAGFGGLGAALRRRRALLAA